MSTGSQRERPAYVDGIDRHLIDACLTVGLLEDPTKQRDLSLIRRDDRDLARKVLNSTVSLESLEDGKHGLCFALVR